MTPARSSGPVKGHLEQLIGRYSRDQGVAADRVRRWVSTMALLGALDRVWAEPVGPRFLLKGGVAIEVLTAYRYQPNLEKRHHQLKSVHDAAPITLHSPHRIEALFACHFIALLCCCLIERELRAAMTRHDVAELPLYHENRSCTAPTAARVLDHFSDVQRHHLTREHHHTVTATGHPRRSCLHERQRRPEVQRAPAPTALSQVKARAGSPTDPAAITLPPPRPGAHHDLSLITDPHVFDHARCKPSRRPHTLVPRSAFRARRLRSP